MKASAYSLAITILLLLVQGVTAQTTEVRVVFVRDGIFTSPIDPAWSSIPRTTHVLYPQVIIPPIGGGSVGKVTVRAMHDGENLAIRLDWPDAVADRGVGVATFRDAAAVGFPMGRPQPPPSPFMGDTEHPIVIWQWAADFDANAEGKSRFGDRYPHSEGVWIFPQDLSVRRQVRGWRGSDPVSEFVANGFGTLKPRANGRVGGASDYKQGRWSVVLHRRLTTKHAEDAAFVPGQTTPLIIAIWNGSQKEVNGRKSVTLAWIPAKFDGVGSTTVKSDVGGLNANR